MKDIELATMAARSYGMDHFVRLPATDYADVMRPLEAGAGGVMISMVRSPAEVEQAVRWAKFWPRGERGLNGGNRDGRFGLIPLAEYTARANAETFIGVQIETAGALDVGRRDRRDPRRRPAVRRPVRPEPGPGRDRRLREPQVPRGDRDRSPGPAPPPEALGHLLPRPRVRRPDARTGAASSSSSAPTSTSCTPASARQGAGTPPSSRPGVDRGGLARHRADGVITTCEPCSKRRRRDVGAAAAEASSPSGSSLLRFCSIARARRSTTRRYSAER